MISKRENLISALKREPVDYIPFIARFNALTPVQRGGVWNYPWPEKNGWNDEEAMMKYLTEEMGILTYAYAFPGIWGGLADCEVKIYEDGDLLRKEIITPEGSLTAIVEDNRLWPYGKDIPLDHDFTAHYRKPWITENTDIQKLKYIFGTAYDHPDMMSRTEKAFQRALEQSKRYDIPVISPVGMGLTLALQMFLPEPLMIATLEAPEMVESFLAIEHEINMKNIKLACELGCDVISRNGYYETCDFYSPELLRHFLKDYLIEECELAKSYGKPIVYTLHTGIMPMIDYLKEIPFDAIFGVDPGFPGVDLKVLRTELGEKFAFEMGPCSIREFSSDNTQDVRNAINEIVEIWGRTGLVLTPSTSFHSIMPWRNFEAAVDEWKKINMRR